MRGASDFPILLEREQNLSQDLSRGQVANEPQLRGQAKAALHRASGLRRNADGLPACPRHEHGFHSGRRFAGKLLAPGIERQKITHRTVAGMKAPRNFRHPDAEMLCQALPERGRQVAHGSKIEPPFGVERMVKLRAAISRLADLYHSRAQVFARFSQHVVLGRAGRLRCRTRRALRDAGFNLSRHGMDLLSIIIARVKWRIARLHLRPCASAPLFLRAANA